MSQLDHLLQPSLTDELPYRPLYSVRAGFFVAFFGGVHAVLIFCFLNSKRLGRERDDLPLYLLLGVAWLAVIAYTGYLAAGSELPAWLEVSGDPKRGLRYATRLLSLLVYGAIYLRLRRFYKAAELSGEPAPNPWKPGLAAAAAGTALAFAGGMVGALFAS